MTKKTYRRPVKPLIPFPPEAVQHTRCCLALSFLGMTMTGVSVPENDNFAKQLQKVTRHFNACVLSVEKRRLSSGAKKAVQEVMHRAEGLIELVQPVAPYETYQYRWAVGMWVALTLLEDARNTCPAHFKGLHWYNLLRTLTTLCDMIIKECPQVADTGTEIYMQAA